MISEKRPRHYAAEYLDLKTKEEKIEYIKTIPSHFKEMVRLHVKITKDRARMRK